MIVGDLCDDCLSVGRPAYESEDELHSLSDNDIRY